ncbi:hypothetical protein [Larsenimonas suaedae]|uniref:Uncharacterized protein n=1 Tax=Larsenimonas suaedae TaxID=1851019 RepID=A0ABU1GTG0_9GAMM|nr:hypothetical protein [Larsenimonas suaedae]MCM2971717.1 hypothetical protein [Larsenimonas suaedae]MDR5895269.1 hypothetical protein [Larsenimonas suaedae]
MSISNDVCRVAGRSHSSVPTAAFSDSIQSLHELRQQSRIEQWQKRKAYFEQHGHAPGITLYTVSKRKRKTG